MENLVNVEIYIKVKIIYLATPNQFHNQDPTGGMNLKEQYGKIRFLTWITIQDIMLFHTKNFHMHF